jgi:hypothetical protein
VVRAFLGRFVYPCPTTKPKFLIKLDYGPGAREGASLNALPLLKEAYGVVLEVGPGNGEWIRHYDTSKVTKIYGVEPNKDHHAALKRKVIEAGLSDVYVLCPVGVEDLGEEWVARGEVDCVVTVSFVLVLSQLGFIFWNEQRPSKGVYKH